MNNQQPTPEDEILNKIMIEIKRYQNNQIEFTKALNEFILTSSEILDGEPD